MIDPSPGRAALRSTEPELSLLDFNVGRCLTRARGASYYTERTGTRMLPLLAERAPAQRINREARHYRFVCSLRERVLR
jgi:hypothetical protein